MKSGILFVGIVHDLIATPRSGQSTHSADLVGPICGRLRVGSKLAEGGCGEVFEATMVNGAEAVKVANGTEVVVKSVMKERWCEVAGEVLAMQCRLHHENLLSIIEIFTAANAICIVMPLAASGDLFDYMNKMRSEHSDLWSLPLQQSKLMSIATCVSDAVHYLHRRCLVHRDVKPENILLGHSWTPQLTDYGLMREVGAQVQVCGSRDYMAPELMGKAVHAVERSLDDYSMGVTLCTITLGRIVRKRAGALRAKVRHSLFVSKYLVQLAADMLEVDPTCRMTAVKLCNTLSKENIS